MHTFVKTHKKLFLPLIPIVLLLLLRTILLQKPSTALLYTIKQENLVDTVQVSGTYTTASETDVTSPTNGVLTQVFVTNNQTVKKGDPLFHVDSTATIDQQETAFANYENALSLLQTAQNTKQSLDATMWTKQQAYLAAQNKQNYKNDHTNNPDTKNDYTDLEKLAIDNGVVQTQKDFTAAEQAYQTANITVGAATAQVQATKQAYDNTQSTTVTAPASGTVVNLLEQAGDQVFASNTPGTQSPAPTETQSVIASNTQPVLVIANLSDPSLVINISEDYATRVKAGQKASIVFDGLKNKTFLGTVAQVATVGTITQGVVTYSAKVLVSNLPTDIKPNMTALITIETLRKDTILDVPNSAIITQHGQTFVEQANTKQLLPVTIGVQGLAKTEITNGVPANTTIIADPEDL